MKFAPQSLRSLGGAPKNEMYPWCKNLVTVFAVWWVVTYATTCFVKKSWKTRIFATLGSLFSSMVISILVKSMCWRSIRVVDTVGCKGTFDKLPPCCKQCIQDLGDFCTWSVIPGHQKHSHNKDSMQSCPQCPASWWHPFGVAMPCALATVKSRRSSALPLGVKHRYKAPWWIMKFCWFCKTSLPSLLEACCTRSIFRSVCFCAFSQSSMVLSSGSSFWALAQLVTCISTNGQPAATHTSGS